MFADLRLSTSIVLVDGLKDAPKATLTVSPFCPVGVSTNGKK